MYLCPCNNIEKTNVQEQPSGICRYECSKSFRRRTVNDLGIDLLEYNMNVVCQSVWYVLKIASLHTKCTYIIEYVYCRTHSITGIRSVTKESYG